MTGSGSWKRNYEMVGPDPLRIRTRNTLTQNQLIHTYHANNATFFKKSQKNYFKTNFPNFVDTYISYIMYDTPRGVSLEVRDYSVSPSCT